MEYNGHKNKNYWNVALWLANDEGFYTLAKYHVRRARNRTDAAKRILGDLVSSGNTKTPDGIKYTISAIRQAIIGF